MKTKEELNSIRKEIESLSRKLAELTEEELAQVAGGGIESSNVVGYLAKMPHSGTDNAGVSARTPAPYIYPNVY